MKQNGRGFTSYFIFIMVLLMIVGMVSWVSGQSRKEDYTRAELIADMTAGKILEVRLTPNQETPTGFLEIELNNGLQKKLYVTDITEAEELVRSYGLEPTITDVPRESWFLTTLVPILILVAVGVFLFLMVNRMPPEATAR